MKMSPSCGSSCRRPAESGWARPVPSSRTRTRRAFATGWARLPVPTQRSSSPAPTARAGGSPRLPATACATVRRNSRPTPLRYGPRTASGGSSSERPSPSRTSTNSPAGTVDVEIEAGAPLEAAGLWVDGEPAQAVLQGTDLSHVLVHAEQVQTTAARPVGVVFARTSDQAQAGAFALDAPAGSA